MLTKKEGGGIVMDAELGKYVTQVKGQDYIKYSGLLSYAHKKGLVNMWIMDKNIDTENKVAIVQVKVQISDEEGMLYEFEGIGSANKQNTPLHLEGSYVELAHTRAKARALRDALNIDMNSFEEVMKQEE